MSFRPCCVVPSRNHHLVVGAVVQRLRDSGLPVFLVDDASDEPARSVLAGLDAPDRGVVVLRLDRRAGKGGAVIAGFERAAAAGFTHCVQVDADGQHDLDRLPDLLVLASANPRAVVSGAAAYDQSVPAARRYGRYLTHAWVWVETLSFRITDSMCGFRAYPLAQTMAVVAAEPVGRFMDFDTDILVRLAWRGVPVIMVPVRVTYPAGNRSNFELLRDNWRITRMHTRLVLTMLCRLPRILGARRRHQAPADHWSGLAERGAEVGLALMAWCYWRLGRTACRALLLPVATYFYLTGAGRRRASQDFLERAGVAGGWLGGLRHHLDFGEKALETFASWAFGTVPGGVRTDDTAALDRARASGRGALLIVSHLGNADLARALLDAGQLRRLTVLVHTRHAERYNRLLRRFQPDSAVNLLQVTEIGPDTVLLLEARIARGDWVAIAGDRTPIGSDRVCRVPFLGTPAAFSQGPYILAHLLRCPVYLLFCVRERPGHRLYFEEFAERIELRRPTREATLTALAARYADRLAHFARRTPYQWYNFYDFWAEEIAR